MTLKRSQPLSGVINVTLSSGDGTQAVTFDPDIHFRNAPTVLTNFMEALGTGKRGWVAATGVTALGFTISIDSDSAASDLDVSWIAIPRRSSEEASQ